MIGGIATFYISHYRYYPVAFVNSKPILARDLSNIAESAFGFYLKAFDTYKKQPISEVDAQKLLKEVKRATLEKLIEEKILSDEIASRFGGEFQVLIDKKLQAVENGNLQQAASGLYGLGFAEFRKTVLEPEARRELLAETFKSKNENFGEWLKSAKQNASVFVLIPGFAWQGMTLEIKN